MKKFSLIFFIFLAIILNIYNYDFFLNLLSLTWYVASILIMYSSIKYTYQYKFIQIKIANFITSIKSKSKNETSPLSSLCISLSSKIGVGSLSGIALAVYYGGIGTIFWICFISLIVSINTYVECLLGIKYRQLIGPNYVGGPAYYIKKSLGNKNLSFLYSILIIITYSILFLSIQSNTIINTLEYFNINKIFVIVFLFISVMLIIIIGYRGIKTMSTILVPIMLLLYFLVGLYVIISNYFSVYLITKQVIIEAFNIKSILSSFLIGMQRAIFITESSIGTSAISSSNCDNDANNQGMLEVLGIHIIIFIVCLMTFFIISTSNYQSINFHNINGIEIILYAFNYHFGSFGRIILSIITILFAFSTILSSYYFGESNLTFITNNKFIFFLFKICFLIIIIISSYISPSILWNLTDYFVAILVIINISSIIKIKNKSFFV